MHVLKRVSLGPEEICSFVIGDACGDVYNPFHEWKVIFPPVPKPEVLEPKVPTVGFLMQPQHLEMTQLALFSVLLVFSYLFFSFD